MLSHIDRELFPDRCEVVVLRDPQRYVYPIFKNGRSALARHVKRFDLPVLLNQQIKRATEIDVYLRDPLDRFISGISTFCQMTMRDHPNLDPDTVSWFAERYFSLNSHYSTQFSWILNLSRFADPGCLLALRPVSELKDMLGITNPAGIEAVLESQSTRIRSNLDLDMYVRFDQTLVTLVGQKLTISEICRHMRNSDPEAWKFVVQNKLDILSRCIVQD